MFLSLLSKILSVFFYLALHVTKSGAFPPPLSAKEERALLIEAEKGDLNARNKLVEHNLRLVVHIAKKYSGSADNDDLISIGTIGLIKGVSTFKAEKGNRLATYAARCIDNEILMYFRASKKTAQDVSFNEPIDTDKDGNTLSLGDIISDSVDIAEEIDTKLKLDKLKKILPTALEEREYKIICMRYGLGCDELTQQEIANKLKISRSYVSRIEKAALKKLRPYF
jgi:RNA polymerase sporulation-specific sigma factor